jgi:hypothetical protein
LPKKASRTPCDAAKKMRHASPVAEKTGAINTIGRWALDKACEQMSRWRERGVAPASLAVNVPAAQIKARRMGRGDESVALGRHPVEARHGRRQSGVAEEGEVPGERAELHRREGRWRAMASKAAAGRSR